MAKELNLSKKMQVFEGWHSKENRFIHVSYIKEFIKKLKEADGITIGDIFTRCKHWNESKWKEWEETKASKVKLIGVDIIDKLAGKDLI